ncbi:uncharacterized protein LOC142161973 [Nicotiana tabacum]|uniref:Uncharacterized protein LOC142161973 n=1 Tax=Nicotiana tabacum TaxID=4097 RepID=A0AC58RNR4_TOBAC
MGESTPSTEDSRGENSVLIDLTSRISQMLSQTPTITSHERRAALIGIKLNDTNYGIWSQVVEIYINGDLPQPFETNHCFRKWIIENSVVKGWLINSMDPSLIGNYVRFPIAKVVWDSIATTYFDGGDTSQVYDLNRKVTQHKQSGGSIVTYYNNLQGREKKGYNSILQEDRVYMFLDRLDDRLDKIRGDMLQLQPFPTVEQASAHVRR